MGGERHAGLASGQPCVVPADFALLSSGRGSTRALGTPGRPSPWPLGCGEARETAWGSWVRLGAGSCPTASRLAFGSHLSACWAGGYPALPSASEPPPAPACTCQEGQDPARACFGPDRPGDSPGETALAARAHSRGITATLQGCAQPCPKSPVPTPRPYPPQISPAPGCHSHGATGGWHSPSPEGLPRPRRPSLGTPCWAGAREDPPAMPKVPGCVPAPVPPACQAAKVGSKGPPGEGGLSFTNCPCSLRSRSGRLEPG